MESPDTSEESMITGEACDESPGTGSGTEGSATIGAGTTETVGERSPADVPEE